MILSQGYSHFRRFVNSQILFFHTRNTSVTGPSRCRLDRSFFFSSFTTHELFTRICLSTRSVHPPTVIAMPDLMDNLLFRLSIIRVVAWFLISSSLIDFYVSRFVSLLLFASDRDTTHAAIRKDTCCRLTRGKGNTEQGLPEKNKTRKNMENNKKPDQKRFDEEGKAQWNQGKRLRLMLRYCSFQAC